MRQSGSEKVETIRLVEDSELSVTATVRELGIPRSTFYGWNRRYKRGGRRWLIGSAFQPWLLLEQDSGTRAETGRGNGAHASGRLIPEAGVENHRYPTSSPSPACIGF